MDGVALVVVLVLVLVVVVGGHDQKEAQNITIKACAWG